MKPLCQAPKPRIGSLSRQFRLVFDQLSFTSPAESLAAVSKVLEGFFFLTKSLVGSIPSDEPELVHLDSFNYVDRVSGLEILGTVRIRKLFLPNLDLISLLELPERILCLCFLGMEDVAGETRPGIQERNLQAWLSWQLLPS